MLSQVLKRSFKKKIPRASPIKGLITFVLMKKLLYFIPVILLYGCNDGDVITNDFEFENAQVQLCEPTAVGANNNRYVFYKNETTNFESLVLQFTTGDDIMVTPGDYGPYAVASSPNLFEYRKLTAAPGANYYCNDIPPVTPVVTEVYTAVGGQLLITTSTLRDDDNDGILASDEGAVFIDGVIDLAATTQDTDGDGILDYLDEDDDGDNVPTRLEGVAFNADGTINLAASRDTDGDGIPDYLDPDDDGDGVLTINEDLNRNLDPTDDGPAGGLPNYLVPSPTPQSASPAIENYREHRITRRNQLNINLRNLSLQNGSQEIIFENYFFGIYPVTEMTLRCTPAFPTATGSDVCRFQ